MLIKRHAYPRSVEIPVITLCSRNISIDTMIKRAQNTYNNRKRNTKIVHHTPISRKLLLIPQIRQSILIIKLNLLRIGMMNWMLHRGGIA